MKLRKEYGYWQRVLEDLFFSAPNEPILLFIDDDELARLAPDADDPVASLREAIQEYVVPTARDKFSPINRIVRDWRRADRKSAPPVLPLLAMCVLAATRMDSSPGRRRSNNYYGPLGELLTGQSEELSSNFFEVHDRELLENFWISLKEWIDSQKGRVGISTIRSIGNKRLVGYPLSQSILKTTDKKILIKFINHLNLAPMQTVSGKELLSSLEKWRVENQGFSKRFKLTLNRQPDREILEQLMEDLVLRRGDDSAREVVSFSHKVHGTVEIAIEPDLSKCFFLFRLNEPGIMQGFYAGERKIRIEDSEWPEIKYGYPAGSIELSKMNQIIAITNAESTFRRKPFKTLILEEDYRFQAWVEAKKILPGQRYRIIATGNEVEALQNQLPGLLDFHDPRVFRNSLGTIRITKDIEVADADQAVKFATLTGLKTQSVERVREIAKFQGGLKLSANRVRHLYFVGGEPDYYSSETIPSKTCPLLVNGKVEELKVHDGKLLKLRDLRLPPGEHTVKIINQPEQKFSTSVSPIEMIEVGFLGDDELARSLMKDDKHSSTMLLKRNCVKTIFLIKGGHVHVVKEPGKVNLAWDSSIQLQTTQFETEVPTDALYVAQHRRGKWRVEQLSSKKRIIHDVDGSLDLAHQWYLVHKKNRMTLWHLLLTVGTTIDDE